MKKVLVISNRLLGDSLDCFPALEVLFRFLPQSEFKIDLLTPHYTKPLYRKFSFDRVFSIDKRENYLHSKNIPTSIKHLYHISQSLKNRYTMVIIFPGGFGWALWARWLRPRFIVGDGHYYRWPLLSHRVTYLRTRPNYENFLLLVEKAISLLIPSDQNRPPLLGDQGVSLSEISKITKALPKLIPTPPWSQWWGQLLQNFKKTKTTSKFHPQHFPVKHYVVIAPTASETNKTWSGKNFYQIADQISRQGYSVFWVGLEKESPIVEKLSKGDSQPIPSKRKIGYNTAGLLKLPEVFSLIQNSHAFLSNDSGLAHIAPMLKVPTIVIYGPGDPTFSRPWSGGQASQHSSSLCQIYQEHPKIPHEHRRRKKFQTTLDIHKISPEEAWEKMRHLFPKLKSR